MQETISIMVADQDYLTLEKVKEAMKEYSCLVTPSSSTELILEALCRDQTPDVIIVNLEKPFDKTFDVLPDIKARLPRVEIVFVSNFDDEMLWVEAIQRGAYDFLPKPLQLSELKRILLQAIEKHRPLIAKKPASADSLKVNTARASYYAL